MLVINLKKQKDTVVLHLADGRRITVYITKTSYNKAGVGIDAPADVRIERVIEHGRSRDDLPESDEALWDREAKPQGPRGIRRAITGPH